MPNRKNMTLEEFLQVKADSTRNAAFEKSRNRKTGIKIPYKASKEYLKHLLFDIATRREIADSNFIGPSIKRIEVVKNGTDNIDYYRRKYYNSLEEYNNRCNYGDNCIGTSTDNYPEDSRTNVNIDFKNNHQLYGFKQIPFEEVLQGDIVQVINEYGTPFHGMIFAGYNKGEPIFNYSRGGVTEYDYKINGMYPNPDGYLSYRYVGTPELIEQWTNEYNSSSNNTNVEQKRLGGMKKCRKKKFIGGLISSIGSVASAGINAAAQLHNTKVNASLMREQIQSQKEMSNRQNASAYLSNMNRFANQDMEGFYDKYRPQFKCGGKVRFKANLGKFKDRN